jgi:ATP/maltotriose-dependent transcriptional regulator MalT
MSEDETIVSKITRPRLAVTYPRTDLHTLLDEVSSRRLVVVSGPPGAGKSTLVASYIESRNLPNIWYRVDGGDNDPATFFNYLAVALREAKPHTKIDMPHLTLESSQDITAFAKRYFREFYRQLQSPFLIVLDNYQDIAEDAGLHEAIRVACTDLPQGGRILIITTKACPPPLARLRANNMVAIIEWDDLQLTPNEVNSIAALHRPGLPADEADKE